MYVISIKHKFEISVKFTISVVKNYVNGCSRKIDHITSNNFFLKILLYPNTKFKDFVRCTNSISISGLAGLINKTTESQQNIN